MVSSVLGFSFYEGFIQTSDLFSATKTQPSLRRRNLKSRVFTLKTHQMISVHTTPWEFKNDSHRPFWIWVSKMPWRGVHMIFVRSSFSKCFLFTRKRKVGVFKLDSSSLKSVFEKLRFGDGLVWTVVLTVEIKLRFQISLRSVDAG